MPNDQNLPETDFFGLEHKPIGWVPLSEIAKGDVSVVFKVADSNGKNHYAMKVEQLAKGAQSKNIEKSVLAALHDDPNSLQLLDYNTAGSLRFTIMTLAGPDFNVVKNMLGKKFSDSTILRLSIRTLMAIKSLHEHCYVHRDIEPANLAISLDPSSRNVYLLDFGAARQFARRENGKWTLRAPRSKVPFRGSVQYCSPKTHDLEEVGRVDDLWSWLYVFIEMRVYLPWTDSTHESKFGPRKRNLLEEVLQSDPFLRTFIPVANLLKTYKYEDRPDYLKIFEILSAKMTEMGVKWSDPMDYDLLMDRRTQHLKSSLEDDKDASDKVTSAFNTVVVPGGKSFLVAPKIDFFAKTKAKEGKEKKGSKEGEKNGLENADVPSKGTEMASRQKMSRVCKKTSIANPTTARNRNKTRSTTSSASRQTPPSPENAHSLQPKHRIPPSVATTRTGAVANKVVQ